MKKRKPSSAARTVSVQARKPVAAALKVLEQDYHRRVEILAEQLRPRFAAGALHGWGVNVSGDDDHDCADSPLCQLEEKVQKEIRSDQEAYLVLALSAAERCDVDAGIELGSVRFAAATCLVVDAFRLARERGWWRPRPGEWIGEAENPLHTVAA